MSKRLGLFLALTLLLGLALGCGLSGLTGGEEEEQAPPAVEQVEEAEEAEEIEAPEEEENVSLSSITDGLQSLDSYRAHFLMTFEGSTGSEEGEETLEMDMESTRDPSAQRIIFRGGEVGVGEGFESVRIGDQQYVVFGEGQCMSSSAEDSDALDTELFKLEDVVGGLDNAHRVRPDDTINGVRCRHYTFDEKGVAWAAFTRAQGEVWIAVDGNYVVKYVVDAEGKNPVTGDEGHVEWEYEISDVNQSFTIEPPAGCEAAESEFPIMSDATNLTTMGGMVSYESSSSFDDVKSFYEEQMPAAGWSDTGDSFVTSDSAMLSFTKDGRTATVTVGVSEGTVTVFIMAE
jgi:hypothetical protein